MCWDIRAGPGVYLAWIGNGRSGTRTRHSVSGENGHSGALASAPSDGEGADASERTDVLRLRPLLPLGRVELDLLVLVQRPVAGARDCGEVHEHVRRPVIGGDE